MWKEGTVLVGLLVCAIVALSTRIWRQRATGLRFPPGPPAWPLIGHLHLFSHSSPHRVLRDVSSKYGPILGLRLGQHRAVVVSSAALAKEVLLTHDKSFAGRPPFEFPSLMQFGSSNGIAFDHRSTQWRQRRKICVIQLFTAKRLRELQHVRQQEMHHLLLSIHRLSRAGTTAVDVGKCVGEMSSRLMMRLVQSKASAHVGDEDLQQLIREEEREMIPTMGDLIPCLSWLDIFRKQRMRRIHARLDKVYTEMMLMRRKESRCLHYDDLLNALISQEESLTTDEMKSIINDIVGGGIHTTALTLEWVIAELLRNPNCLCRLQEEVDREVGGMEQLISDANLSNLTYLKCVVKEAFRLHPIAPFLIPHMSTEECEVQGYTIPAKTIMYVNVWAIGRDEQVWQNANEFLPERFTGRDIGLGGQHFELLPFGSGRRVCVGLPLALSVVELTLANLVRCFDWELPDGETHASINMDERLGLAANRVAPVFVIPRPRAPFSNLTNI